MEKDFLPSEKYSEEELDRLQIPYPLYPIPSLPIPQKRLLRWPPGRLPQLYKHEQVQLPAPLPLVRALPPALRQVDHLLIESRVWDQGEEEEQSEADRGSRQLSQ